jgi:hypothetical protein
MSREEIAKSFIIIDNTLKKFSNEQVGRFIAPQNIETILSAEKILNVYFPLGYKNFLKKVGYWSNIYGLTKNDFKNAGFEHVVNATLDQRHEALTPHQYVIISSTGDGGYYALDTSRMNEEYECPVVLLDEVHEQKPADVAEDCGQFLLWQLEDAEKYNM